jgi:hypothetical protein
MKIVGPALAMLVMGAGSANAALTITFAQVGANVVASGSGSLDFQGLTSGNFDFNGSEVNASSGFLAIGQSGNYSDYYGAISGPASFGAGGDVFADPTLDTSTAPNNTGAGVDGATGRLLVPGGYFPGAFFTVSSTWDNTTISGLGLTPGQYIWTWGQGGDADSLEVDIPGVPEPATWAMMLVGFGGIGFMMRRPLRKIVVPFA